MAELNSQQKDLEERFSQFQAQGAYLYGHLKYPLRARAGYEIAKLLAKGADSEESNLSDKYDGLYIPKEVVNRIIFVPTKLYVSQHENMGQEVFTKDDRNLLSNRYKDRKSWRYVNLVHGINPKKYFGSRLTWLKDVKHTKYALEYSKFLLLVSRESVMPRVEFYRQWNEEILASYEQRYGKDGPKDYCSDFERAKDHIDSYDRDLATAKLTIELIDLYAKEMGI